jgi:pimeloyl-ACP methyl ester carboxylesterase
MAFLNADHGGAMAPTPTTVSLSSGLTLSYVDQGHHDAPAIVLLHGVTDSWRSFELVLSRLPAFVRAVAVSQRGHGDSDKPQGGYRIRDFASDVAEFLDRLDLARAVVVGHSSHGLVAQRFAIDHPSLTAGIVLESSFTTLQGNNDAEKFVSMISALRDPIDPEFVHAFQQATFVKPVPRSFIDSAMADAMKVPAHVWRAVFEDLLLEDYTSELRAIEVPTLIIWGDRDSLIPRDRQDELASGIPDAKLIVYEGAGHSPHWEEPERFAADLVAFVDRVGSATGERQ